MQMLIDTNVIMDVLVGREPFLHHSQQVVKQDCLQMECGQSVNVSYIVTRNIKDFVGSNIPCLTPIEVCSMFHQPLPSTN